MKVSELIKILQSCPEDAEVGLRAGYEDYCTAGGEIEEVFTVTQTRYVEKPVQIIILANGSDGPVHFKEEEYKSLYYVID